MTKKKELKKAEKHKKSEFKAFKWQAVFAVCSLFMLLFTLLMTAVLHPDFVRMSADLNPFVATGEFFHESLRQAGGLLSYSSRFLQSLFYYPLLGGIVLSLIYIAQSYVLMRLYKVSSSLVPLCFAPSLMHLINFLQLGYMIYVLKAPAMAFTLPFGTLCALLLSWLYASMRNRWVRAGVLAVVVIVGYPVLGFFALLALLLCLLSDLLNGKSKSDDKKSRMVRIVSWIAVAVLSFLVPTVYFRQVFTLMSSNSVFTIPLPDYYWQGGERMMWMPFVVSLVIIVVLAWKGRVDGRKSSYAGLAALVIAAIATFKYTYNDANFNNILKMSRAVDAGDWNRVVDVARGSDVDPTRLEVMFRNLALQKMGSAAESMFTFEDGDAAYKAPRENQFLRLAGARSLYYYYGKVNYSYRWCMEDMVEYGMRPAYVEYMLRCALVNEEPQLVEKYRNLLSNMPFRSSDLKDYGTKDEGSKMPLQSLMNYNDLLDGDAGLIEVYLLNNFALTDGGSKEMVNLSLQCNMIMKDINGFWPRFIQMYPTFEGKIPLHYQEAAILFSALEQRYDISDLPIDAGVKSRFGQMVQESTANSGLGDEENAKRLKPMFGDTYWYYYFFVKGLKTN